MKAKNDGKSKGSRRPLIPKEELACVTYYNTIIEGAEILFEGAAAGDLEFFDRLKRVADLALELGGTPETYPLSPTTAAAA